MKQLLVLILCLCSISCFSQQALHFTIEKVYSRGHTDIGTWDEWQQSNTPYDALSIDFNDNEILWGSEKDGKTKWLTELLISSKMDYKYKNVGFKYVSLTGAGLDDNKNIIYEIAYLDQEVILLTSDGNTQTKYCLKEN